MDHDEDDGENDDVQGKFHSGLVLRDQDRFIPASIISRMMKKSIPMAAKISGEAKESMQKSVSEFISFLTSEANAYCHEKKRRTLNGEDILHALSNLGLESYVKPMTIFLQKYRDSINEEKGTLFCVGRNYPCCLTHTRLIDAENISKTRPKRNICKQKQQDVKTIMVGPLVVTFPSHYPQSQIQESSQGKSTITDLCQNASGSQENQDSISTTIVVESGSQLNADIFPNQVSSQDSIETEMLNEYDGSGIQDSVSTIVIKLFDGSMDVGDGQSQSETENQTRILLDDTTITTFYVLRQ